MYRHVYAVFDILGRPFIHQHPCDAAYDKNAHTKNRAVEFFYTKNERRKVDENDHAGFDDGQHTQRQVAVGGIAEHDVCRGKDRDGDDVPLISSPATCGHL